jgi:hypothetical protein
MAAPAARNQDFLARSVRAFQHCDTPPALPGAGRRHQAGSTRTQDYRIEVLGHHPTGRLVFASCRPATK